MLKNIIYQFGIPRVLITDNGTQFRDRAFQQLCQELHIDRHFSSVAQPQTNGQVEVTNRTILHGLRTRAAELVGQMNLIASYGHIELHCALQWRRFPSPSSMVPRLSSHQRLASHPLKMAAMTPRYLTSISGGEANQLLKKSDPGSTSSSLIPQLLGQGTTIQYQGIGALMESIH